MHSALWKLYRLRVRGALRNVFRKLKTVRGALLGIFTLLIVFQMFGSPLLMYFWGRHAPAVLPDTTMLRERISLGMLVVCLLMICLSLGQRSISFSPSEIDFLFPGPFSRRQLLGYKILGQISGAAFMALAMATSQIMLLRSWAAAFVGVFLAWLMIGSLTMCVQLVGAGISARAFTRARRALLAVVVLVAALGLGYAASQAMDSSWEASWKILRHAPVTVALLAPFDVFARIIAADRLVPDALGWVALATAMVVATYAVAMRLDADYLETAVRVSQQIQDRKRGAMSDGIFAATGSGPIRSSQLPQPPWWGGAGPLAWRQLVQGFRGSRRALLFVVILCTGMGITLMATGGHHVAEVVANAHYVVIGVMAYLTLLMSSQAPLGFRNDFERMDLLKSLPFRPLAVAFGETIVLVLIVTGLQGVVFAVTGLIFSAGMSHLLLAGWFALPYNWLLFAAENFLFLLYPTPALVTGSEGVLQVGRAVLFVAVKFLMLVVCAVVAGVPAAIVYALTKNLWVTAAVAWLALLLPAAGVLFLVAWAFRRYDVSAAVSE